MSITDEIKRRIREKNGKSLFFLPLLIPGDQPQGQTTRELFVSKEVWDCVAGPLPAGRKGMKHSELRGRMDAFSRGDRFSVAQRPYNKGPGAMLARTDPVRNEIWDIRTRVPPKGIRCFGAFGGKNLFVALTWEYREHIKPGRGWKEEIERCKAEWQKIFGSIPRYRKGSLDEYLTNFHAV